jgi:hypothetical protein
LIERSFVLLSSAWGWTTITAADAGEPAVAGVAGRAAAAATGLREVGRAEGLREAAEATGLLGAETGAEAATWPAAEATLRVEVARAGDEAPVPREAARAAEEEATVEAARVSVALPAAVGVGTAPPAGVAGTRGRSLGEGAEEDPGTTPRRRRPRQRRPLLPGGSRQRRRRGLLDPSVSASPVLFLCLTLPYSVFSVTFEALTVHQVV